jgi:hypothetical protein
MSHLSPAEFVDLVDGTLASTRAAHVERCAECRAQAAALQAMLRETVDIPVPDPPPFFWDRLSARISASVADTRSPARWRVLVPLASAAALVIAAIGGAWIAGTTEKPASSPVAIPSPIGDRAYLVMRPEQIDDAALDAANGEVWDVLTSVASEMQIEDATAAGMSVHSAAIDGAVQKMTPDELRELGRLLRSELKGSGD